MIARFSLIFVLVSCATFREESPPPAAAKPKAAPVAAAQIFEEALPIGEPPGRRIPLDHGFALYRDNVSGYRETLVTPNGGQIAGAPNGSGLACKKTTGFDCRIKGLTLANGTLYLITNQQVYAIIPDGTLFNVIQIENPKFETVTFDIFADRHEAAIAWDANRRIVGILAYRGGWNVFPVTSAKKYQTMFSRLAPKDIMGLRVVDTNTYGIVLNNRTMLTVTVPATVMLGAK